MRLGGACVRKDQIVKAGEVIGYSGNTGFTSLPPLHFHVYIDADSEIGWETLEIQFKEPLKVIRNESDLTESDKKLLERMTKYDYKLNHEHDIRGGLNSILQKQTIKKRL